MTHTEEVSTTFESKTPTEQMNGHSMVNSSFVFLIKLINLIFRLKYQRFIQRHVSRVLIRDFGIAIFYV